MLILFKYIFKRLMLVHATLIGLIVGLIWLAQSLRYMDLIINNRLSLVSFFSLVKFLLPDLFVMITPLAFSIALLFGYHKLMLTHEVSAFRSIGMSNFRLAKPALVLGGLLATLLLVLNIFVVPKAFQEFRQRQYMMQSAFSSILLREGNFNTVKNTTVYVREHNHADELKGVFIYQVDGKKNVNITTFAKAGKVSLSKDSVFIYLSQGRRQTYDPKTGHITEVSFDELTYDLADRSSKEVKPSEKPTEKSLVELLNPPQHFTQERQGRFRMEAHQRILLPLLCLLDALIVTSMLLGAPVGRIYKRRPLVIASIAVFIVHIATIGLINASAKTPGLIVVNYILFALGSVAFLAYLLKDNLKYWFSVFSNKT